MCFWFCFAVASRLYGVDLAADHRCFCVDLRRTRWMVTRAEPTRNFGNNHDGGVLLAANRRSVPTGTRCQKPSDLQLVALAGRKCGAYLLK